MNAMLAVENVMMKNLIKRAMGRADAQAQKLEEEIVIAKIAELSAAKEEIMNGNYAAWDDMSTITSALSRLRTRLRFLQGQPERRKANRLQLQLA